MLEYAHAKYIFVLVSFFFYFFLLLAFLLCYGDCYATRADSSAADFYPRAYGNVYAHAAARARTRFLYLECVDGL